MKTKRLSEANLMFREGVLVIEFSERNEINTKEAKEILEAAKKLTNNEVVPVILVDHHPTTRISPDARDILSDAQHGFLRKCEAYVSAALSKRNLALLYIRYHKPENPAQVFSNFNAAWNWSMEILSQQ
ncbi:MAG: hypothetical protein K1X56_05735 [Flavobacteriales bacterium]|nr:hypothetical protein [Flavobacteriales bacterium]